MVRCRFDKRITEFAELKFARDGINVKLGSMVVNVGENEITAKERSTGRVVSIPHGMVVWSTGIGARPELVEFMKQLGQVCFFVSHNPWTKFATVQFLLALNYCCYRLTDVHWSLMNG